jgi:hypothetical protein
MQTSEVKFVKELIRENQPKKLLEIGVAAGSCLAIMLNEIKDKDGSMVFGVDYNERYYRDNAKKSGWIVNEWYPELEHKYSIFSGGVSACFLDGIGENIEFCVLHTAHVLPGELLDFLMVLPYLKENAICVLHNTNLQNLSVENGTICVSTGADKNNLHYRGDSYFTNVLMSTLASEKIFPTEYLKNFALVTIMAFKITADLRKYIQNVFYALALPWQYKLSDGDKKIISDFMENNYSKDHADYFYQIAELMEKKIDIEKKNNQERQQRDEELDLIKTQLDSTKTEQSEEIAIRQEDIQSLQREVQSLKHEIDVRDARIASIYQSLSWTLTSPLRMVDRWLKIRQ